MSRNSNQWHSRPNLPDTHFVDTSIYTSDELFCEEQEKIFKVISSMPQLTSVRFGIA